MYFPIANEFSDAAVVLSPIAVDREPEAVVLFPIAVAASQDLGVSVIPYAITLMVAASASFSTPIGYQTNMIVWGPGEYRFVDFLKLGVPLTVVVGIVTLIVVPLVWPF